jgi:hypothetical protein
METVTCIHDLKKYTTDQGWVCRKCSKPLTEDEVPTREGFPALGASCFNGNPTKAATLAIDAKDAAFSKDGPAYKRLRQQGFQPTQIDGSAEMETRATTRFEIESGRIMEGQTKQVAEAIDIIESTGAVSDVFTPVTTPTEAVA